MQRKRTAGFPAEIIGYPNTMDYADARASIDELHATWALLSTAGDEAFRRGRWRDLGLGAVEVGDPAFVALAGEQCVAWSTLDVRDRWGQTTVDIARRHFPERSLALDALNEARAELWEVATATGPQLVLQRVRDGLHVEVHGIFGSGAFPSGHLFVARVARGLGVNAVVCSTVVRRAAALERLQSDQRAAGGALVQLALDAARAVTAEGRGDDDEAPWLEHGPRLTRRVHRAVDDLVGVVAHRAPRWRGVDAEGRKVGVDEVAGMVEVFVDLDADRRLRCRREPRVARCVEREIAFQAGLASPLLCGEPGTRDDWELFASSCRQAAARFRYQQKLHRAA